MNKIEITLELLAELKEKAQKATHDEWPYDVSYLLKTDDLAYVFNVKNIHDINHIAAANPQVTLALIAKIELLEKEADWLAEQLARQCQADDEIECGKSCEFVEGGCCNKGEYFECYDVIADDWREAARKAVEKKNGQD